MPSDDRDPVDVLAEEFADRLRRGEHPSVTAYAAAHPEHAEQLNELLPAVAQMELLKRFRAPTSAALPDRLGDFRIVRELGRGGMGVVFEAVQESLGRRVALKVLARHAQLDTTRRERFVREAQAAAKLHHTNIVPVFAVGEQDGLPYYAMQLIPGHGLHALVRRWRKELHKDSDEVRAETRDPNSADTPPPFELVEPDPAGPGFGDWRFVAEVGMQAADALHYAHKQGVLHRDVKPANLILDRETVWVTDFGLAKLMGATSVLTGTGDILGTLQYLPPECLAGEADARSDVYGLGATLYELLTLEPPYAADSPAQLVAKVTNSDPRPPRALNPNIPRDLETVVLKAMSREPAARYATARELARDLEAFLDDRPIRARRQTLVARAWRTCRRNPAVASLAFSTAAALVLAAVTGWVGYARTTAALERAEDRRTDAEQSQARAEAAKVKADRATDDAQQLSDRLKTNLNLSLRTFEQVFEAAGGNAPSVLGVPLPPLGGRGPGGPPGVPPGGTGNPSADLASDKAAILEAVLGFYDKLAEQNTPNAELRAEAAKASRRVCEANVWLKHPDRAVSAYRRAVGLLEPLAADALDNETLKTELLLAHLAYLSAPADAFPADHETARRRATELARGDGWVSGAVQYRVGWAREQANDLPGATASYRDALATLAAVPAEQRPAQAHLELAFVRLRLAYVLYEQTEYPAARTLLEKSLDELRPHYPFTPKGGPGGGGPRPGHEWLDITYLALIDVCKAMNDTPAAERYQNQAFGGFGKGLNGPGGGPGGRPFDRMWNGGGMKKDGGPGGKKDGGPKKN